MAEPLTMWTLWSERRPVDTETRYRWRIAPKLICGMMLRPEWTEKLRLHGMGHYESEWWPTSRWDGYQRTVPESLQWRPAQDEEVDIMWGGLDLLPCPHTGKPAKVGYRGNWIGAPPYEVMYLTLHHQFGESIGWTDAVRMQAAWNLRAASPAIADSLEGIGNG